MDSFVALDEYIREDEEGDGPGRHAHTCALRQYFPSEPIEVDDDVDAVLSRLQTLRQRRTRTLKKFEHLAHMEADEVTSGPPSAATTSDSLFDLEPADTLTNRNSRMMRQPCSPPRHAVYRNYSPSPSPRSDRPLPSPPLTTSRQITTELPIKYRMHTENDTAPPVDEPDSLENSPRGNADALIGIGTYGYSNDGKPPHTHLPSRSFRPPYVEDVDPHTLILEQLSASVQSLQGLLQASQALLQKFQATTPSQRMHTPAYSTMLKSQLGGPSKHSSSGILSERGRTNLQTSSSLSEQYPLQEKQRGSSMLEGHRRNEDVSLHISRISSYSGSSPVGLLSGVSYPNSPDSLAVSFTRPGKPSHRPHLGLNLSTETPLLQNSTHEVCTQQCLPTPLRVRDVNHSSAAPVTPTFIPTEFLTPTNPSLRASQDNCLGIADHPTSSPGSPMSCESLERLLGYDATVIGEKSPIPPAGDGHELPFSNSNHKSPPKAVLPAETDDEASSACSSGMSVDTETVPRTIARWRSRHAHLLEEMRGLHKDIHAILGPEPSEPLPTQTRMKARSAMATGGVKPPLAPFTRGS